MNLGNSHKRGSPEYLVDNVERPGPFGRPQCLEGMLMECVIHRLDRSPDNAGHWRSSVALVVPLGRVSARLRKEPTNTFGKSQPHPRKCQSRPALETGIRGVLNGREHYHFVHDPRHISWLDARASQLPRDVEGSSRPLLGAQKLESKRKRLSVNMGTRETRLSRVVAQLGWSVDQSKHLPRRQSSGRAPVVVRDVSDVHMAKGCRMVCVGTSEMFCNLEASK